MDSATQLAEMIAFANRHDIFLPSSVAAKLVMAVIIRWILTKEAFFNFLRAGKPHGAGL